MPRPPRPPRPPRGRLPTPPRPPAPPRAPKLPGPIRLSPLRSRESLALDTARTDKTAQPYPPFVRFDRFLEMWKWEQGQHITTIGPTGSGKTVLNRQLLRRRDFVVVLGIKNRDRELYGPFENEGYELVSSRFDATPDEDESRILFVPRTQLHGSEARRYRTGKFREVLNDVVDVGGWCVYADDVQYQVQKLNLGPELEELWLIGRSENVSLVVSSTEPVDIPVMAYGFATHLFLFKNPDLVRARRMAELTGINREVTEQTLLKLPQHEFLYVNKNTGVMLRSRVIRD